MRYVRITLRKANKNKCVNKVYTGGTQVCYRKLNPDQPKLESNKSGGYGMDIERL